jgi:hypothetical protein
MEGPCRSIYLGPIRKIELLANLQSDVEWLRQVCVICVFVGVWVRMWVWVGG